MLIKTEKIRKLSKLFEKVRIPKHAYYGSIYIDFSNEYASFRNETSVVKFTIEIENKEEIDPIFIMDGDKFFFLANSYDEIVYLDHCFQTPDGNTFELASFSEDYELPSLEKEDYTKLSLVIDNDFRDHLKKLLYYASSETPELHGVFFENDVMIAIQPTKVYQAFIHMNEDFKLPFYFLSLLFVIGREDSSLYISDDKNSFIYETEDYVMKFVSNSSLALPVEVNDPDFVASYNHETVVEFNKNTILEGLKFLNVFTKDIVNSRLTLEFLIEESSLLFKVDDESNKVEYKVEVNSFSDNEFFKGKGLTISLDSLSTAISHLADGEVLLHYDDTQPAIMLENKDKTNYFVVLTRMMDN